MAPPLLQPITVVRPDNPTSIEPDHSASAFNAETEEIAEARYRIAIAIDNAERNIAEMRAREAELLAVLQWPQSVEHLNAARDELERHLRPSIARFEAHVHRLEQIMAWTYKADNERNPTATAPTRLSAALIRERLRLR